MAPFDRPGGLAPGSRVRRVAIALAAYVAIAASVYWIARTLLDPRPVPAVVPALLGLGILAVAALAWRTGDARVTARPEEAATGPSGGVSPGSTVGHFAILERLGQGGMGIVYRARDTRLDRLVALKFLPESLTEDEEAARRFLQEARTAAKLDHPNICTIHEVGSLMEGRSFIAMAYYEGRTLSHLIRKRGSLPFDEACGLGAQVAAGLAAAHAASIVHRDIKPANLFLTADGVLKILDFGIAKTQGIELTAEGAALGTVAYMSPEQVRGAGVDGRTDLWALGVVLYELCTGSRPFTGSSQGSVMHAILEAEPPPLAEADGGVPAALSELVHRCLAKDPEGRPSGAAEVAETLRTVASPGSHDRPDPPPSRAAPAGEATGEGGAQTSGTLSAEGERRQATILVAEVAGRSLLEESLTPEESEELAEACRGLMAEIVEAHRGAVNRNTGERLQALFGIPLAEEGDPRRAIRAARELCERVRELLAETSEAKGLGLRVGVESGRVVVRDDASDAHRYRVVGGPAETSARLATQAPAGEVLVGPYCRRLVEPFFETTPAGALPSREGDGEEATPTFRIERETGARSRLEAAAPRGLTELRGRNAELGILLEAARGMHEGGGRFVSIVGDAGVGKSRLLYEFERRLEADAGAVVRGRCQAFGGEVPYLPFVEVLRDVLELSDPGQRETPELIAERVTAISDELEPLVPFYLQLLGVGGEDRKLQEAVAGEQLRVGLVESLSALLTLGARKEPTIALLEDWHWVDGASRQVLRQLLEMLSAYPLLIVVTARPDIDLEWGAPAEHIPIALGPLGEADSQALIRSALEGGQVPAPLARLLHDRTGGNPFFLEEICRALSEDGTLRVEGGRVVVTGAIDHLRLPETVQGVLRTRLDRLDEAARRLVRYASVIGREFPRDVLERALPDDAPIDDALDRLRELGLIQRIRLVPSPVYRFQHALTQDVAYDGLLERQRAAIHGAVGEALETLQMDRAGDQLDRLADHFARAGRWEKAVHYATASADRLWSLSEFQEAAEVQGRALEWVDRFEDEEARFDQRVELLLRQERLYEYLGLREDQQAIIDRLFELLDPDAQPDRFARALIRQGDLHILMRDSESAERALGEAVRLCRERGEREHEGHALRSLGLLRWHQKRYEEAIEVVQQALELDREFESREGIVSSLTNLGQLHRALGQHERALEILAEALDLAREGESAGPNYLTKESYILHVMGTIHSALGDREKALECLREARTNLEDRGRSNVIQMHFHITAIARQYLQQDRIQEALELYEESVRLTRKTGVLEGLSISLRLLGEVLLNLERHEEALPCLREAAEIYVRLQDRPSAASMWRAAAAAAEALGERETALGAWAEVQGLASRLERGDLEMEAAEGRGRVLRGTDPTAALGAYQRALELARAAGDRARAGRLLYTVGLLHWELGAYEEALRHFEEAYEELLAEGHRVEAGLALNSVGRTLRDLGRLEEAAERLEAGLLLHRETGERLLEGHALATLGDVHLEAGRPDDASQRFGEALKVRSELGDVPGQGWMYEGLARAQRARGSGEGVAYYVEEARAIASRTGDRELAEACDALLEADGDASDPEE